MNVLIKLTRNNFPKISKYANIMSTSHNTTIKNINVSLFNLTRNKPYFEISTIKKRQLHTIDDHEYIKMSMEDFLVLTPIDGIYTSSIFIIF